MIHFGIQMICIFLISIFQINFTYVEISVGRNPHYLNKGLSFKHKHS